MTLHPATETFIRSQQNENTRLAYRKDLVRFLNWNGERVGATTEATDAIAFRGYLAESGLSVNTQARVWSTVKAYMRYLVITEEVRSSPFEYIKGPKKVSNVAPKTPSDADVTALTEAAANNPQRGLVIALLLNGLRASEVASLKRSGIETHEGIVFLRVVGKGNKERLVPMTVEAQQAFARFVAFASPAQLASPLVVSDYDGSLLSLRQVQHAVYKSAEYAGIEGMHAHALRHHYATRLIRAGASPLHVRDLLGHASVATTQVYVLLDLADLAKAAGLDPRNVQAPASVTAAA